VTVLTPGPDGCGSAVVVRAVNSSRSIPMGPRSSAPAPADQSISVASSRSARSRRRAQNGHTPWSTLGRHRPEPPRKASDHPGPAGSDVLCVDEHVKEDVAPFHQEKVKEETPVGSSSDGCAKVKGLNNERSGGGLNGV
jgi:hypothetical protein